jgi:hypothetical protein
VTNAYKQLLVLIQGRYLTGEDYERLVTVFPGNHIPIPLTPSFIHAFFHLPISHSLLSYGFADAHSGTNLNGVKIKVSRFRVEQRNMYDQLGWQLPEGGAVNKKRKEGDREGGETPKKKARGGAAAAKKGAGVEKKKKKKERESDGEAELEGITGEAKVREEDGSAEDKEVEVEVEKPVKKQRAKKAVAKKQEVKEIKEENIEDENEDMPQDEV